MDKKTKTENESNSSLNDLMGKTTEFWNVMTKTWMDNAENLSKMSLKGNEKSIPGFEDWETLINAWKPGSEMFEKNKMESIFTGMGSVSENWSKLMKTNLSSFNNTQSQFMKSTENIKESMSKYKMDGPGAEVFELFQDIYQKEISKFFSVPQLGLTRYYQEKMITLVDKFNLFQVNMFEFMYLLYSPFWEVIKVMQGSLADMKDQNAMPKNLNDYYKIWIKMLEEKYMELFRSTEYIHVLSNALSAMNEFLSARQAILQDILKMSGIPGVKDMDELYKDIYTLKKRIAILEKQVESPQGKKTKK